jgi:hypothetical protein
MTLLISDPSEPGRYRARAARPWHRLAACLLASSLDRRLAAGEAPERRRLLALRAQTLSRPETRRTLARSWERLLAGPVRPTRARVPLRRRALTAVMSDVERMLEVLEDEAPTPARGVAMVSVLLRDGAGPLYNGQSPVDLGRVLQEATAQLDPGTSLTVTA